uniref:Uncharacterized protein n=1 Tax=Tetraselmis chuii TaxID=63592 RepID=A0A7S1ST94_9CHLO
MPRAPLHPANSLGTMPKGDRDWSPFAKAAVGVCHSLRTEAPPKKKMRTNGFGREEAVVLSEGGRSSGLQFSGRGSCGSVVRRCEGGNSESVRERAEAISRNSEPRSGSRAY